MGYLRVYQRLYQTVGKWVVDGMSGLRMGYHETYYGFACSTDDATGDSLSRLWSQRIGAQAILFYFQVGD